MKATKKAPVKKAKKAPAKPKVKEVIVRWDIINPLDGELFGLAAELGKSKRSAISMAARSTYYSEVVRVTIERF